MAEDAKIGARVQKKSSRSPATGRLHATQRLVYGLGAGYVVAGVDVSVVVFPAGEDGVIVVLVLELLWV